MTDWQLTVENLKKEKQKEEENKRLELVSSEINELKELEIEFQNAGLELMRCKQTLAEITEKNSPEIAELTLKLSVLKAAISEIDVDLAMQDFYRLNARSAFIQQQTLVKELAARKDAGELEFAEFMVANQRLQELEQSRENETGKLKEISDRFNALRAIPDVSNLSREIAQLKMEALEAQQMVESIERNRREISSRMNFLRNVIAKNSESVAV